jgi:hypothetical protein
VLSVVTELVPLRLRQVLLKLDPHHGAKYSTFGIARTVSDRFGVPPCHGMPYTQVTEDHAKGGMYSFVMAQVKFHASFVMAQVKFHALFVMAQVKLHASFVMAQVKLHALFVMAQVKFQAGRRGASSGGACVQSLSPRPRHLTPRLQLTYHINVTLYDARKKDLTRSVNSSGRRGDSEAASNSVESITEA